jgi:hypothetical protein
LKLIQLQPWLRRSEKPFRQSSGFTVVHGRFTLVLLIVASASFAFLRCQQHYKSQHHCILASNNRLMSLTPARSASAPALHFSLFGRYMRWVHYFCCLCYVWLIVVSLIVRCFLQCRSRSSGSTLVMTFAHLSFVIVHLGILF